MHIGAVANTRAFEMVGFDQLTSDPPGVSAMRARKLGACCVRDRVLMISIVMMLLLPVLTLTTRA